MTKQFIFNKLYILVAYMQKLRCFFYWHALQSIWICSGTSKESNGSLPPDLRFRSPVGRVSRTGSAPEPNRQLVSKVLKESV